jgi:hypothetical protein
MRDQGLLIGVGTTGVHESTDSAGAPSTLVVEKERLSDRSLKRPILPTMRPVSSGSLASRHVRLEE